MTHEERNKKIESYGTAHQRLVAALERFPREMWQFRPAPGRWTIHEIIIHIADSEANSYIRCRRFLAEPGSTVLAYDQNRWAHDLRYHDQSTDDALELFKWLRHKSYALIKDLPESVWLNTVHHSESGEMIMDDWLDTYERHIPGHVKQMQANYDEWVRQKAAGFQFPKLTE
jgi:DinB superfamily